MKKLESFDQEISENQSRKFSEANFKERELKPNRLEPNKKLKFARNLILIIIGAILLLIFAKASINSESMDEAFSMVIPTFLGILGLVTAYYFEKN